MKNFLTNKYKIINLVLLLWITFSIFMMDLYRDELFVGKDIKVIYDYHDAIYQPIYTAGKTLIPILAFLLLFLGRYFRQWLYYVLPIPLILTILVVSNISVHTNSLTATPRYLAAEYGMYVLGVCTLVFVLWQSWRERRGKKE